MMKLSKQAKLEKCSVNTNKEGKKIFSCNICEKVFRSKSDLYKHIIRHTGENKDKFCCEFCPKKFIAPNCLISPTETFHKLPRARKFECEQCGSRFFSMADLKRHANVHLGANPFSCNICRQNFQTLEELNHHKNAPDYVNGHTSLHLSSRTRKRPVFITNNAKEHECVFCKKAFRQEFRLHLHILEHIKEHPFICTRCPYETLHASSLRKHAVTHDPNRKKDVECTVCEKKFFSDVQLRIHNKMHLSKEDFQCLICDKKFPRLGSLKRHVLLVHDHSNRSLCNICGKRVRELSKHIPTHTGENRDKYSCLVCRKKYSSFIGLKLHMDTAHNPNRQKTVQCEKCPRMFFSRHEMKTHLPVHFEQTPFSCNLCTSSFKWKSNLSRHIKEYHKAKRI